MKCSLVICVVVLLLDARVLGCPLCHPKSENLIWYTIEAELPGFPKFSFSRPVKAPLNSPFITYMEIAADEDPNFEFECAQPIDPVLGCFVTTVNGLEGNNDAGLFWAFIRRDPWNEDCLLPLGVSSYIPRHKEHLVMSFKTFDVFNKLPDCETGQVRVHA